MKMHKRKLKNTVPYTKTDVIVINDKLTANGKETFNFYDSYKPNRIIGFASPTGLKCLAESMFNHADGTFHTATRYTNQLYVIHAYFPPKKIEVDGKVWVKMCMVLHEKKKNKILHRCLKSLEK